MEKEYKVSLASLLFYYLMIVVFICFSIFVIIKVVLDPNQEMRWFASLWVGSIFIFMVPQGLKMPHTIILHESDKLVFKSLISNKEFNIGDLQTIKTGFSTGGQFIVFKFNNGKIKIIKEIDNLYELISKLKQINGCIETKGC